MFLEDLDVNVDYRLSRLNTFLKEQHGITLSEESTLDDLYQLQEDIHEDTECLRMNKDRLQENPSYARNLILLESINLLIQEKEKVDDPALTDVLVTLAGYIGESWSNGYAVDIDDVVNVYTNSGHGVYDPDLIEEVMRGFVNTLPEGVCRNCAKEDDPDQGPYDLGPSASDGRAAEIAYRRQFGNEPVDFYGEPDGGPLANRAKPGKSTRARAALAKNQPSMLSKLKNFVGI